MDLPDDSILRNFDGDYDFPVTPGAPAMFTLTGEFDTATVVLKRLDGPFNEFVEIEGGTFTSATEQEVRANTSRIRLSVSGSSADTQISVVYTEFTR